MPSSKIIERETLTQNHNPDAGGAEAIKVEQERRLKALINEAKKSQGASAEAKQQPTACVFGVIKRNWR